MTGTRGWLINQRLVSECQWYSQSDLVSPWLPKTTKTWPTNQSSQRELEDMKSWTRQTKFETVAQELMRDCFETISDDAGRGEQDHVERWRNPLWDVQGHPQEDPRHQVILVILVMLVTWSSWSSWSSRSSWSYWSWSSRKSLPPGSAVWPRR